MKVDVNVEAATEEYSGAVGNSSSKQTCPVSNAEFKERNQNKIHAHSSPPNPLKALVSEEMPQNRI